MVPVSDVDHLRGEHAFQVGYMSAYLIASTLSVDIRSSLLVQAHVIAEEALPAISQVAAELLINVVTAPYEVPGYVTIAFTSEL